MRASRLPQWQRHSSEWEQGSADKEEGASELKLKTVVVFGPDGTRPGGPVSTPKWPAQVCGVSHG